MRAAMTSTVQRLIALAAIAGVLAMVGCSGDDDGDQAPTANAGQNRTVALAAGQTTADVTLDGSGSTAANGMIAAYAWTVSTTAGRCRHANGDAGLGGAYFFSRGDG